MNKLCALLLVFWVAACTAIPSPSSASETPAPSITLTPSITPSVSATPGPPTSTSAPPTQMEVPRPAPTLIIPTLQIGSSARLILVQMIDAQTGWGIQLQSGEILRPRFQGNLFEAYILRTTDGGKTWQNVTPPTGAYFPGSFFALDANTAWASGNSPCCTNATATPLWRTTDGGKTWNPSQPFRTDPGRKDFYWPASMQFIDQSTGWLLASMESGMSAGRDYILFHTTDGGETWTDINDNFGVCWIIGFAFINSTTGWFGHNCFARGVILEPLETFFSAGGLSVTKTVDGGRTFTGIPLFPQPIELQRPELARMDAECNVTQMLPIASEVVGLEWGCNIYTNLTRYRYFALTPDGGRTWNSWPSAGNESFIDAKHGWRLLAPGQLQQTTDGGMNWVTLKMVTWENVRFDFISAQEGWALVSNADSTALVHTTDGGNLWEEIKPVISSP